MPDKKDKSYMWIEPAPGLPTPKGEPTPKKREERPKMPPVPDMSKRLGPKLMRASARGRVRRRSRQRA